MSQSDLEFHRKIARECFNETWNYLDKTERNDEDKRQMLNLAHASRFHWSFVGTAENLAVGDWQVSRVYAALNQPSLAIHFAKSALEICQKNSLSEILVTAYEGMARAHATAKDTESARDYIKKARQQLGVSNADEEDRKIYLDQIRETEELIGK
jgi:hypothetical protein